MQSEQWFIERKRCGKRVSSRSKEQCLRDFFMQWREQDGSIPWRVYCLPEGHVEPIECDPYNGGKIVA